MRRRVGRPGLVGLAARTAVVAGTANAVSGRSQRNAAASAQQQADAAAFQRQQQQQQQQQTVAPAAPAQSTEDLIASLERLGALHQQGILTDEEFSAQKAKVLG